MEFIVHCDVRFELISTAEALRIFRFDSSHESRLPDVPPDSYYIYIYNTHGREQKFHADAARIRNGGGRRREGGREEETRSKMRGWQKEEKEAKEAGERLSNDTFILESAHPLPRAHYSSDKTFLMNIL